MPATIRRSSLAFAFAWLLTACPPWPGWLECPDDSCASPATESSTGPWLLTTPTTSGELQTVTGHDESTTTSGAEPETFGTSAGEPLGPPMIVDYLLTPDPILFNGGIVVTVTAEYADGVRMVLEDGTDEQLGLVKPGVFGGEISVVSGLNNKSYIAELTPWRDVIHGDTVYAPYTVKLPEPGTEHFWENSDKIGPGRVAALGVLPGGEVVEFGTHYPQGGARCYLRRRNKVGKWSEPADLESVLPGIECTAVDMQVDEHGAMFVLANRKGPEGLRWWLAQIPAWGLGATGIGTGAKDETAEALAYHSSGMVAVCGFALTQLGDDDAMVQLFRPNMKVEAMAFDYFPGEKKAHQFDEQARDCVFVGDTLALVGDVDGLHALENVERERLFILRLDTAAKSAAWTVAGPGVKTQSGGQAVDVDDQGRLVVAGYTCDDACLPEGDVRIYGTNDELVWKTSLGAFSTKTSVVHDLTWSLAGYAVVATAGPKGDETAFTVRAYSQQQVEPLWIYTHKDIGVLGVALALAIGHYGEVYAGGMGANGYPAVAYIGG